MKKLCIVILHLLGHTGSIPCLWTPFFYLLKPFTPLLGDSEGVKECQSLPWYVKSNIPTLCGQKMTKHAGNTQLCVIKLLLSADKPTPYFWALNKVSKTRPICEYIRYMYHIVSFSAMCRYLHFLADFYCSASTVVLNSISWHFCWKSTRSVTATVQKSQ